MPRVKKTPEQPGAVANASPTENGTASEVLTLSEAAAYLRLPEADVLKLIGEQGLPGRQLGNEWRFLKTAIQDWLSQGVPTLESNKAAWRSLAGKYRDDPELLRICAEAYRQRGRLKVQIPDDNLSLHTASGGM